MRPSMPACALTLAILVLGAAGPPGAAAQGAPATSADASLVALRERVLAYWNARVKRDYRAEYDLLEPRARARTSADEYGRGRAVEYMAAQVEDVEQRGNFARVTVRLLVRISYPLAGMASRTEATALQDSWVRIGGVWYRTEEADLGGTPPWPIAAD
jgi:hypothetical protein